MTKSKLEQRYDLMGALDTGKPGPWFPVKVVSYMDESPHRIVWSHRAGKITKGLVVTHLPDHREGFSITHAESGLALIKNLGKGAAFRIMKLLTEKGSWDFPQEELMKNKDHYKTLIKEVVLEVRPREGRSRRPHHMIRLCEDWKKNG